MTMPTSWSSAALSTLSPTANFDIENSFWKKSPSGIVGSIVPKQD
jgi:hypothetical protein